MDNVTARDCYVTDPTERARVLERVRLERERLDAAKNGPQPCRLVEYLGGVARTLPRLFPHPDAAADAARVIFDRIRPGRRPQRILIVELASGRTLRTLDSVDPLEGGPF